MFFDSNSTTQKIISMKKLILVLLAVSFLTTVFSQSFELYQEEVLFPFGGTITVSDDVSTNTIYAHMNIKNISNEAKLVMVKKEEISVVPGSSNTFCWVVCWASNIFVSPMGRIIDPGVTNTEFSGDYMPIGNPGVTIMRYTFFDNDNPNDSTHFFVEFNAGTVGMTDLQVTEPEFSNPYPNPAQDRVSFDYVLPYDVRSASVKIHNLMGTLVKESPLSDRSGKVTIDVSDLNDGFYFYSITVNDEIYETKRFVISR